MPLGPERTLLCSLRDFITIDLTFPFSLILQRCIYAMAVEGDVRCRSCPTDSGAVQGV